MTDNHHRRNPITDRQPAMTFAKWELGMTLDEWVQILVDDLPDTDHLDLELMAADWCDMFADTWEQA